MHNAFEGQDEFSLERPSKSVPDNEVSLGRRNRGFTKDWPRIRKEFASLSEDSGTKLMLIMQASEGFE